VFTQQRCDEPKTALCFLLNDDDHKVRFDLDVRQTRRKPKDKDETWKENELRMD